MSEEIDEFLEAVENNEYAEYHIFEDKMVLITDVDSDPYITCWKEALLFNHRSVDDLIVEIGNMEGFVPGEVVYDKANSERESRACGEGVKIWHLEGFEVTQ